MSRFALGSLPDERPAEVLCVLLLGHDLGADAVGMRKVDGLLLVGDGGDHAAVLADEPELAPVVVLDDHAARDVFHCEIFKLDRFVFQVGTLCVLVCLLCVLPVYTCILPHILSQKYHKGQSLFAFFRRGRLPENVPAIKTGQVLIN